MADLGTSITSLTLLINQAHKLASPEPHNSAYQGSYKGETEGQGESQTAGPGSWSWSVGQPESLALGLLSMHCPNPRFLTPAGLRQNTHPPGLQADSME